MSVPTTPAFDRVFRAPRMTLGIVLPIRRGDAPIRFEEQIELARLAETLGFAAIWVRDVPLNGDWYPEKIGHLDPWVMLGAIAAQTDSIALGTAATVLPLRHPLHVAKSAASIQALSKGRLLLGLGSGDRQEEYAAFGQDFADRKVLYRRNWDQLAAALQHPEAFEANGVEFELRPLPDRTVAVVLTDLLGDFAFPVSSILQCIDVLAEDGWVPPLGDDWTLRALADTPRLSREVIVSSYSQE